MGQKVPVLVNRASLDWDAVPNGGKRLLQPRSAVHDEEFGPVQATTDEIVEHCAPGFGGLTAHALDREQQWSSP